MPGGFRVGGNVGHGAGCARGRGWVVPGGPGGFGGLSLLVCRWQPSLRMGIRSHGEEFAGVTSAEGVLPSAHPWGGAEGPRGWGCWL